MATWQEMCDALAHIFMDAYPTQPVVVAQAEPVVSAPVQDSFTTALFERR